MKVRTLAIVAVALVLSAGAHAQITNGSFETGNFSGWTQSGFINAAGGPIVGGPQYSTFLAAQAAGVAMAPTDGVLSSQTTAFDGLGIAGPAISPTQGSFLAFVANETSAGDESITGTSISQTFTVPVGATQLRFDVRLLNNDTSDAFVEFDDFGGVALTQGATVLAQFNADINPASGANIHTAEAVNAGGFVNSTPWTSVSFNVAGLGGQNVTLTAYATNYGGDNSVETRLLIDNIRTDAGAAATAQLIPTLSEWTLVALAVMVAVTGFVRLRRRAT